MIEIIPTCVPLEEYDIESSISIVTHFSKYLHIDIDDGVFVPFETWPYIAPLATSITPFDTRYVSLEVHLMVQFPTELGVQLGKAGVRRLIVHAEILPNLTVFQEMCASWRLAHIESVGIAILSDTSLQIIEDFKNDIDFVQIMSVSRIGEQGALFNSLALDRVAYVRAKYPHLCIVVDGGITIDNIKDLVKAGATRFCVGKALMQQTDPQYAYTTLLAKANSAL